MQELLQQYKRTRKNLAKARDTYKETVTEQLSEKGNRKSEYELLTEMMGSVEYVIAWLETGKCPGNKRGIERRSAYQREVLMDPILLQSHINRTNAGSPANITDSQRSEIESALSTLSEREKDCYIMAHGQGISQYDIAELLGVSRGTVDTYIRRGQAKISTYLKLKKEEPFGISKK
ncbi:sigma-70 family RNA polymerase sigma factor [Brevibacillus daliensis]|uniref:sigma-70 family RNA polymerase sigma factor n=1 Tax=Brevibacillus daliensis TaxID=2892995 RepID=UPI001E3B09C8|nr:sigma-70 family RNA polymerase sigma factor [Brevibacillus daliensis]